MDRRQAKTREAVFSAFGELLSHRPYSQITIQDIIDSANIGRSTFYAHFETKDELLKVICDELFGHIISTSRDYTHTHSVPGSLSVFSHILEHVKENDRNIIALLSGQNSELFLGYFKKDLRKLVTEIMDEGLYTLGEGIPADYASYIISASFVETIRLWISEGLKESPSVIDEYFMGIMNIKRNL